MKTETQDQLCSETPIASLPSGHPGVTIEQFCNRGQIKVQLTDVGTLPNGDMVQAVSDAAGPAVVVKGKDTHLLSPRLESHEIAVLVGESIIAASTPDIYPGWCNLRTASVGEQLIRIFAGI